MNQKESGNSINFYNISASGRRSLLFKFDLEKNFSAWKSWRTNDGRILPNVSSSFSQIANPFGSGSLILLTSFFDPAYAGKSFGGFGMRAPVNPPLSINNHTFIEFDLYYPDSAVGKYMRFEIWSTSSGGEGKQGVNGVMGSSRTQIYIRASDLDSIEIIRSDRIGFYGGETWYKRSVYAAVPVTSGNWEFINIDLHTEIGAKLNGDHLMIGNIKLSRADISESDIPDAVNIKSFKDVDSIKGKYNPDNGYFLIGTSGTGAVEPDSIRSRHYEIFVDKNNLTPDCHIRPPKWLRDEYPNFIFKFNGEGAEWNLPDDAYMGIRDSGTKHAEYKIHGHCLAWTNQSPSWMWQIIPENVASMQWRSDSLFFTGGNNATGPYIKVNKNTARRLFFNHVLYEMRHFMTADERYDSSKKRGVIPFHSFNVVDEEIHESRYDSIIDDKPDEWKSAMKNLSWLMAMTDSDIGETENHYIYLLFKYAHIAVPNARMAANYKAYFNDSQIIPGYMKMDNHDDNGSIDAFITEKPPVLVYNDYSIHVLNRAKVAYNMIREINSKWKNDPLYDGRNLIECLGIQGHEIVTSVTASQNQRSAAMFAGLIDEGLLDCICYSGVDMRQPYIAPGGEARAPAVLNQKQADSIGYQYALLFKLFEKYKNYIDHVIIWSQFGASLMDSYVPFDHEKMASQAYYGIMEPDKFIAEHSYLDGFFSGEYDKIIS
ncbi:MAG: endo-1,4-beta-xylanase [Treponema sp.]|jgi:GH35 family endo-1,4-beta-xylanase|nr:endo-1,4-beta-xylanase [Treponema sp.]